MVTQTTSCATICINAREFSAAFTEIFLTRNTEYTDFPEVKAKSGGMCHNLFVINQNCATI